MELTERQLLIIQGKICPYCGDESVCMDSKHIYSNGVSYGMVYACLPCKAWVGVHKGTDNAKGRLANAELREAKKQAHEFFDQLWKTKQMTRSEAYQWLSGYLSLPPEYTHIGMFSIKTCKDVVDGAKMLLNDLRRLDLDFGAEPKTEYLTR